MRGTHLFHTQLFNPIFLLIFEAGDVIYSACSAANNLCYCEYSSVYISENKLHSGCCDDDRNATCERFPVVNYCLGESQCYGYHPDLDENYADILEKVNLMCFSGTECLSSKENISSSTRVDSCFGSSLIVTNISNTAGIWSLYKCFTFLGDEPPSCCIRTECSSFSILERKCQCHNNHYCLCYSKCDLGNLKPMYNAHAIFISFGDYHVSERKNTAVVILIIMLVVLAVVVILLSFKRVYWSTVIPGSSLISATYTNAESVDGNINQVLGSLPDELERGTLAEPCTVRNNTETDDLTLPSYYDAINSERKAVDPPPKYDATSK